MERERESVPCLFCIGAEWLLVQGCLAHMKPPPPLRTTTGLQAKAYCRVLGGSCFLCARYPCIREGCVAVAGSEYVQGYLTNKKTHPRRTLP